MFRHRRDRKRGTAFIEFALLLPMFLFLILFSVDMGRVIMIRGVVQDATQQAARTGAQVGGAGNPDSGPARLAFNQAITAAPSVQVDSLETFTVVEGQACGAFVTVAAEYDLEFITPGLGALFEMFSGERTDDFSGMRLEVSSVARCEVTRIR